MKKNGVLSLLGLAAKAGKVVSGEFAVENAVKSQKASLVIIGTDSSDNTKKLFQDKGKFYRVPVMEYGTREELGHCIGKDFRSSVAVLDTGFAQGIIQKMKSSEE